MPSDHDIGALLRPLCIGCRGSRLRFDTAFILATDDAEIALLTPVWIPRICDLPILHTILHTPADHLHSVATRHATGFVLVDASAIVLKVAVDGECNLNRAAFRDGLLEAGLSIWRDGLAGECVLVTPEVIMGCLGIGIASSGTSW